VVIDWDDFTTDTFVNDTAEGNGISNFWLFRGPSISHLMTAYNSGPPTDFGGAIPRIDDQPWPGTEIFHWT
jgi:hypothetical protein